MKFLSQCEAVVQDPYLFWISVINPMCERIQRDLIANRAAPKFVKLATRHRGMIPFAPPSSPVPVADTVWFRSDFGLMMEHINRKAAPSDRRSAVSYANP